MAVLVFLLIQQLNVWSSYAQQMSTLNNAKQLHIATLRMVTDAEVAPDPKLGWPGDVTDIKSIGEYAERLVEYKYIDRGDLKSLFYAPDLEPYAGSGELKPENNAFKIYKVKKADVSEVIFIATKNFTFGKPLDPKEVPFGSLGAVIMHKGGDGRLLTREEAKNSGTGAIGLMPGATSKAAPGTERDILK